MAKKRVFVSFDFDRAPGVLKELTMARRNQIHIVHMIGYKDANPTKVPNAGRLYRWNRENLTNLFG